MTTLALISTDPATQSADVLVVATAPASGRKKGVVLAGPAAGLKAAARRRLEESLSALEAKGSAGEIVRLPGAGISSAPLVLAVGVVGTAGGYAVGPWIIRTMYATDLHSRTLAMLALGSALYMLALALAQAVLALNGHALVGLGWSCGMAAFVIVTWLSSHDLFRRIEFGLVASSAAALVTFAIALRLRLRAGAQLTQAGIVEAVIDVPFDA